jgi:hypothetical protein
MAPQRARGCAGGTPPGRRPEYHPFFPGVTCVRIRFLFTALLATCLLAACGGDDAGSASDDGGLLDASMLSGAPETLPATIESEVYFDVAESELEWEDLTATDEVIAMVDLGEEGGVPLNLIIPGDLVKAAGVHGDGEKVRLTLTSKRTEGALELFVVSKIEKL